MRRKMPKGLIIKLLTSLMCLGMTPLKYDTSREYQVKAVFLYNFTQFIEWPNKSFATSSAPMIIGILGDDPFGSYLDKTVSGEKINNHPLVVHRYKNIGDIENCHILFIKTGDKNLLKSALDNLEGRSVLTVSDEENFEEFGGVIRFFTENNKIRMLINLEAAKAADLNISSKLLRLAEVTAENN